MKLLLYFFILFVFLGGILFVLHIFGTDMENLTWWEILVPAAIPFVAVFIYLRKKSMQLDQRGVQIQFLDD